MDSCDVEENADEGIGGAGRMGGIDVVLLLWEGSGLIPGGPAMTGTEGDKDGGGPSVPRDANVG